MKYARILIIALAVLCLAGCASPQPSPFIPAPPAPTGGYSDPPAVPCRWKTVVVYGVTMIVTPPCWIVCDAGGCHLEGQP